MGASVPQVRIEVEPESLTGAAHAVAEPERAVATAGRAMAAVRAVPLLELADRGDLQDALDRVLRCLSALVRDSGGLLEDLRWALDQAGRTYVEAEHAATANR